MGITGQLQPLPKTLPLSPALLLCSPHFFGADERPSTAKATPERVRGKLEVQDSLFLKQVDMRREVSVQNKSVLPPGCCCSVVQPILMGTDLWENWNCMEEPASP